MFDTYTMQEHICKELEKKGQTGIKSTTDLDTVWKLIGSYKNLLKIDMLQQALEHADGGEYSEYSERRRRDSMGRYSRDYERGSSYEHGGGTSYADREHDMDRHSGRYSRNGYSGAGSVTQYKEELKGLVQKIMEGAENREEREEIRKMIQELGRSN